jgi:hypothetical protein
MESLLLSCGALASPTMCRFIPALSDHNTYKSCNLVTTNPRPGLDWGTFRLSLIVLCPSSSVDRISGPGAGGEPASGEAAGGAGAAL